jgi:hypothetical protein
MGSVGAAVQLPPQPINLSLEREGNPIYFAHIAHFIRPESWQNFTQADGPLQPMSRRRVVV